MPNLFRKDLNQAIHSSDHQVGNPDATVQIVIYADFADPLLLPIHALMIKMLKTAADDMRVVYRHFPQTLKNPYSFAAAQALEAAGQQGKFWEMLEQILAHQHQLSDGMLRQYAHAIKLDIAQFEDDFSDAAVIKHIQHDAETAKASKVDKAAAIFINGVRQQSLSMRFIQELIASDGKFSG